MRWALGCLRDGKYQLLGAWTQAEIGSALPGELFAGLEIRGVESIRFVVGNDLPGNRAALRVPFVATELPSIEQTLAVTLDQAVPRHRARWRVPCVPAAAADSSEATGAALSAFEHGQLGERHPRIVAQWRLVLAQWAPLFALPAGLRQLLVSGDLSAVDLHESLLRSVVRHGCFANQGAALDVVIGALLRA